MLDLQQEVLDFFAQTLHDEGSPDDGGVRVFVTGRTPGPSSGRGRRCRTAAGLVARLGRRRRRRSGQRAVGRNPAQPSMRPQSAYSYDPDHPVPWQPRFGSFVAGAPLRLDESHLGSRDDVLCYLSEPVDTARLVVGAPRLILWAQTDAADTDWVVTLADVFPGSGRSLHLAHGIVRAGAWPAFAPHTPVEYAISLTSVAHELRPGHRLRVSVTSSLFPLYARNTNVADPYRADTATIWATQRVFHDEQHPSRLEIEVSPPANQESLHAASRSRPGRLPRISRDGSSSSLEVASIRSGIRPATRSASSAAGGDGAWIMRLKSVPAKSRSSSTASGRTRRLVASLPRTLPRSVPSFRSVRFVAEVVRRWSFTWRISG